MVRPLREVCLHLPASRSVDLPGGGAGDIQLRPQHNLSTHPFFYARDNKSHASYCLDTPSRHQQQQQQQQGEHA